MDSKQFSREKTICQGFPILGVIVLLLVFFAVLYLTKNKWTSLLVALLRQRS